MLYKILPLILLSSSLLAQRPGQVAADTAGKQPVQIDHADIFEYLVLQGKQIKKLKGNVQLRQDTVFMYCDSAIIENDFYVTAKGKVIIQQGDSIAAFADSLIYQGDLKIADLFGEVVLVNGAQQLFTNRLTYDLNTKTGTYQDRATLVNGQTQLSSIRGYYYVDSQEAFFKDSVVVVDPDFSVRADTLSFNTQSKRVHFLGPTLISSDSAKVYCESGYYDTTNETAEFTQNAQYSRAEQKAQADKILYQGQLKEYTLVGHAWFEEGLKRADADTIRYNQDTEDTFLSGSAKYKNDKQFIQAAQIQYNARTEAFSTRGRSKISDPPQILEADQFDYNEEVSLGKAIGNVIWQDTSAQISIFCQHADYDKETGYFKAAGGSWGRPWLVTLMEGDSLFLAADTLVSLKIDTSAADSTRLLLAYHDVRVYKTDLQAICDSLIYNSVDSLFRFFHEPLVWSDTSQFDADTIAISMANKEVDKINLHSNSMIVNSADEILYNQIQGKNITAFFHKGELKKMQVVGNAQSVYYALDEAKAYVGVNKTLCSEMMLYFGGNSVEGIRFYAEPQSTFYPVQRADHEGLKLKGFHWETARRPRNFAMLFEKQ